MGFGKGVQCEGANLWKGGVCGGVLSVVELREDVLTRWAWSEGCCVSRERGVTESVARRREG